MKWFSLLQLFHMNQLFNRVSNHVAFLFRDIMISVSIVSDVCVVPAFAMSFYIYILGHLSHAFIQGDLQRLIRTLMAESTIQGDSQLVKSS